MYGIFTYILVVLPCMDSLDSSRKILDIFERNSKICRLGNSPQMVVTVKEFLDPNMARLSFRFRNVMSCVQMVG